MVELPCDVDCVDEIEDIIDPSPVELLVDDAPLGELLIIVELMGDVVGDSLGVALLGIELVAEDVIDDPPEVVLLTVELTEEASVDDRVDVALLDCCGVDVIEPREDAELVMLLDADPDSGAIVEAVSDVTVPELVDTGSTDEPLVMDGMLVDPEELERRLLVETMDDWLGPSDDDGVEGAGEIALDNTESALGGALEDVMAKVVGDAVEDWLDAPAGEKVEGDEGLDVGKAGDVDGVADVETGPRALLRTDSALVELGAGDVEIELGAGVLVVGAGNELDELLCEAGLVIDEPGKEIGADVEEAIGRAGVVLEMEVSGVTTWVVVGNEAAVAGEDDAGEGGEGVENASVGDKVEIEALDGTICPVNVVAELDSSEGLVGG